MDIAEVIASTGLPASSLRYYEEIGLITSTGRMGLRRQFAEDVIERLAFITLARRVGFSLAEIGELLPQGSLNKKRLRRDLLQNKADELDKKIKELSALRKGLQHAIDCPADNHFECPTFLRLLHITNKKKRN